MNSEILAKLQSLGPEDLEVMSCNICGNDTFIDHIRVVKPKFPIMHGLPSDLVMNQKAGSVCANPRCSAPYGLTREQFEQIQENMLISQYNSLSDEEKSQLPKEIQDMINNVNKENSNAEVKEETQPESNIVRFDQFKKE